MAEQNCIDEILSEGKSVDHILNESAKTFLERNAAYGNSFEDVPRLLKILFPNGVDPQLIGTPEFHLFHMIICKISRFANSKLKHMDSIHDTIVYAAMIESELTKCERSGEL